MRNFWKKLTASLLALVLTVQLLPVSALTDEFEIDDERHDTFTYEQPDVSGEISESARRIRKALQPFRRHIFSRRVPLPRSL